MAGAQARQVGRGERVAVVLLCRCGGGVGGSEQDAGSRRNAGERGVVEDRSARIKGE